MRLLWRYMRRIVVRALAPVRRWLLARLDARYVTATSHRRDIKDTLWEINMLRRELVGLREGVDRLRKAAEARPAQAAPASDPRVAEAHRLATETAAALDKVLQNEVRVWQAIDELRARLATEARQAG